MNPSRSSTYALWAGSFPGSVPAGEELIGADVRDMMTTF